MTLTLEPAAPAPPVVDNGTRREFLAGAAALTALLAAGCGGADTGATAETRTVESARGPVEVPVDPRRVATTYTDLLDVAVALGLPVAGAPGARGSGSNPFPRFLPADRLGGATRLNVYPEVEIEALAAVRPDLILNSYAEDDVLHERLSAIAPTLSIAAVPGELTWQDIVLRLADAFGRRQVGEQVVDERRELARTVREAVEAGPFAGATFATGFASADGFSLYGADISPCPTLLELGLTPLPSAPEAGSPTPVVSLSPERLGDLRDADVLFVTSDPPAGGYEPDLRSQEPLRRTALWSGLPAVTAGAVFDYPVDLVFPGPYSDRALLALLRDQLS